MTEYVPRDLEKKLRELAEQFPAVVVTGPRQCGKSTLLRHLFPQHSYLSLDDPLVRDKAVADPELLLDRTSEPVIIDEIQYAPELLPRLKLRIDAERSRRGRFLLTGSQQFGLMRGVTESLAGRVAVVELLTFSRAECIRAEPGMSEIPERERFVAACLRGSYPELVTERDRDAVAWYGSYVQTYLERDVRSLYGVGDLRDFQRCLQMLAARCGQLLNLSEIGRDVGVSVPTVKRWVSILEACRLVMLLPPYHRNIGKRVTKSPKIYFTDCGLVAYLTGLQRAEHILDGPLAGVLFENYVVQETLKAGRFVGQPWPMGFVRLADGREIDLVVEVGGKRHLAEMKLTGTPRLTMAGALTSLARDIGKAGHATTQIVCLTGQTTALSREVEALTVGDWLQRLTSLSGAT